MYDLIVIGSGPAGYAAAVEAADLGMKTAIVEQRAIGGTCLNRGCIPTKALLRAARTLHELRAAKTWGISAGEIRVDYPTMFAHKERIVETLRDGVTARLRDKKIDTVPGAASIEGIGSVVVGERRLAAQNILIATGSEAVPPAIPGLDLPGVITSDDILANFDPNTRRVAVLGGGILGVEFATILRAFGCEVELIEAAERILPAMDEDIAAQLQLSFRQSGIRIHAGRAVRAIEKGTTGRLRVFAADGGEIAAECDLVLVATGQRANARRLFRSDVGVALDGDRIVVDETFETSLRGVYAAGDVVNRETCLASLAAAQGINAVCAMNGRPPRMNLSEVPSCIYTFPAAATVGMTAHAARTIGKAVRTGKCVTSFNPMHVIEMSGRGFVKVVLDAQKDTLLGAQIVSPGAAEMIGEFAAAIGSKVNGEQLARLVRVHPGFGEVAAEALGRALKKDR